MECEAVELAVQMARRECAAAMARCRHNGRWPYTYACDYLRMKFGFDSRSEASRWRQEEAQRRGILDDDFARELATAYVLKSEVNIDILDYDLNRLAPTSAKGEK